MLVFWAVVAVFIIITLVLLVPPLLKNREVKGVVARKDLTITVYQDQFEELDNDLNNGTIVQEQYDQAKIDLEKSLLEDIDKAEKLDDAVVVKTPVTNKVTAFFIVMFVPVVSVVLYGAWGGGEEAIFPESIPEEVRLAEQKHNQEESIESLIVELTERLEIDPTDGEGWYMLARTYMYLKRFNDSVSAFEKTIPLGGDQSADVLSGYADAVAMASGRQLTPRAVSILKEAVLIDPHHVKSLWLLGRAAYQTKEYATALTHWEKLFTILEPGSEDASQIATSINETRQQLGMPPMDVSKIQMTPAVTADVISDARIQGTVSLSEAIAAQASDTDTVFVYARAASGSRMPLAIIRKQVKDMPFDFTLDDSMAMNPSMRLSLVPQVVVSARISKSGDATPQTGDLEGLSNILSVADLTGPIALVIDTVIQ